jgi:uncharacterized small protein (DUF1192 family)/Sec-independent protein translocase protein TatA
LPTENGQPDNLATSVTEVSERISVLFREELELAKAEMTQKAQSLARGAAAVIAGAIFGVFAVIYMLTAIAWAINAIFISGAGDLWLGFAVVFALLLILAIFAFLFARSKLRVGAPTPDMAIDEAKKIRATVQASAEGERAALQAGAEGERAAVQARAESQR